ncbi:PREDICTED: nestin [Chrysochloris asiatica]|uniref:Nestin n=1 Tax=Chrysochloris asiatica TaxID=185453 RepID=A0A9B0WNW5_CHRAS|nr:PREDICTED: nestin [Chrysochloris asiatica]
MEGCLGEESFQMWELNRRLEIYLSRVKALEEQNELLSAELGGLRAQSADASWRARADEELAVLRALVDQRWREKHAAEVARDNLAEELEDVAGRCQQQRLARERAAEEAARSRRAVEAEKCSGTWLSSQAADLERELEVLRAAHEEERASLNAQAACAPRGPPPSRGSPASAPEVEELAQRLGEAWRGAVRGYQERVAHMEASLGQVREQLGRAVQGAREGRLELQQLQAERGGLQERRAALEQRLEGRWQERLHATEKFQLAVEALEQEKQGLQNQIAQVLEGRQQLAHLKMSLSLEVATYRTLLEAENTRLQTPGSGSKASLSFQDPKSEMHFPGTSESRRLGPLLPVLNPTSLASPLPDTLRTPMPTFLKSQEFLQACTPTLASTPILPTPKTPCPATDTEIKAQEAPLSLLQSQGGKQKAPEPLWAEVTVTVPANILPRPEEPGGKQQEASPGQSPEDHVSLAPPLNSDHPSLEAKDCEPSGSEVPSIPQEKGEGQIWGLAEEEATIEVKKLLPSSLRQETWQKEGDLDREEIQEPQRVLKKENLKSLEEEIQKPLMSPEKQSHEILSSLEKENQDSLRSLEKYTLETPKALEKENQELSKPLEKVVTSIENETPEILTSVEKEDSETLQSLENENQEHLRSLDDNLETFLFQGKENQELVRSLENENLESLRALEREIQEPLRSQEIENKETLEPLAKENQEPQRSLEKEDQEMLRPLEKENQESLQSLEDENQVTLDNIDQEPLESQEEKQDTLRSLEKETQEPLRFLGEEDQKTSKPLEKENQELLQSLKEACVEAVKSLEIETLESLKSEEEVLGILKPSETQELFWSLEEKNQGTMKPLENEIQEPLGSMKETQETLSALEKENQEPQRPLEEWDLENLKSSKEVDKESQRYLEEEENPEKGQNKDSLRYLEEEGQELPMSANQQRWENVGGDQELSQDSPPGRAEVEDEKEVELGLREQDGFDGEEKAEEQVELQLNAAGDKWDTGERHPGSPGPEEQRVSVEEAKEEAGSDDLQDLTGQLDQVGASGLEASQGIPEVVETMLENEYVVPRGDPVSPQITMGSETAMDESAVGTEEGLELEVVRLEDPGHLAKEEVKKPLQGEESLEEEKVQDLEESRRDVKEADALESELSELPRECRDPQKHEESEEESEGWDESKSEAACGTEEGATVETLCLNGTDVPQSRLEEAEGDAKLVLEPPSLRPPEPWEPTSLLEDISGTEPQTEENQEASWGREDKALASENLESEQELCSGGIPEGLHQEEKESGEESEADELGETLPDSTPLVLFTGSPASSKWDPAGEERPSPQGEARQENDDPTILASEDLEVQPSEEEEGDEEEGHSHDSDLSEEFEDLGTEASLLPGVPGEATEPLRQVAQLLLEPAAWDRDEESDGFADEEESVEEGEADDEEEEGRGLGAGLWGPGSSVGSLQTQSEDLVESDTVGVSVPWDGDLKAMTADTPMTALKTESQDSAEPSSSEEASDLVALEREDKVSGPTENPIREENTGHQVAGETLGVNGQGPSWGEEEHVNGELVSSLEQSEEGGPGKPGAPEGDQGSPFEVEDGSSLKAPWAGVPLRLGQGQLLKFTQREEDGDSWSSGED